MVDQHRSDASSGRAAHSDRLEDSLLAVLDNYHPEQYDPSSVARGIEHLRRSGWMARVADDPFCLERHSNPEDARAAYQRQLQLLWDVGRGSLPLGRVFEGHVNAIELIDRFGDGEQRVRWIQAAAEGALFGVWNTEMQDGVHIKPQPHGKYVLQGAKSFCSGADILDFAIVPGQRWDATERAIGWQMCIVDLRRIDPQAHDRSFWTPLGMEASASHKVDFSGLVVEAEDLLGEPNDYHLEPYFSGGAVRFAAVQLGGAQALYDHAVAMLTALHRERDPYQTHRIARMAIALQAGLNWLDLATQQGMPGRDAEADVINFANMTRTAILDCCNVVLDEVEMALGARGMLSPKPIQRIYTDLKMYLRQPAPDAALAAVGHHAANTHQLPTKVAAAAEKPNPAQTA